MAETTYAGRSTDSGQSSTSSAYGLATMRSDTPRSCAMARSGRRVTGLSGAGTGSPASQTTSNSYVLSVSSVSATRFVESKTSFRTCTPGAGITLALRFVQSIRAALPSLASEMPVQRFITTSSKYRSTKYLSSSGTSPAFLMPQLTKVSSPTLCVVVDPIRGASATTIEPLHSSGAYGTRFTPRLVG